MLDSLINLARLYFEEVNFEFAEFMVGLGFEIMRVMDK
jgi:hypothetical protein